MIANLKYEFTKLFTIRSTYILAAVGLAFSILAMSVAVWKSTNLQALAASQPLGLMYDAPGIVTLICAVIAILVVGHEYRHNTIAYTLTASRSRAKIMLSKAVLIAGFSAALALLSIAVALACYYVGMQLRTNAAPELVFTSEVWGALLKSVLYCIGLALFAWLITSLVRNIVFAIVAFFMIPTIEGLLRVLLKDNAVYLPATALDQVVVTTSEPIISPLRAGLVFSLYFVVGSVISYILFLRRDAN